ncbi:MAG: AMP-binding protein [Rhodobiaceae bacterium]|nr:AMP-binding protein [Rhodobiaceae bacterium]MCC0056179.1 AMP-binding protein [Rhodobiaceae bacterium]
MTLATNKAASSSAPWLSGAAPGAGLARAAVRSDADRAEVERYDPLSLLPADTVYECIAASAAAAPDKPAIIHMKSGDPADTVSVTYRDLVSDIEKAACLFSEAAQGEVPVVSCIVPLHPQGLVAVWGAGTVGIANPINPFLDAAGVASIMNSVKANVLVVGTSQFGAGAWDRLDQIAGAVPTLKKIFLIGDTDDDRSFAKALAAQSTAGFASLKRRKGSEDSVYMPTGGTTGAPKIVRHSQDKHLIDAWLMGALFGASEDEVVAQGMPHFHVGGLVAASLRAVLFGQTILILTPDGFRNPGVVGGFWNIMKRFKVTSVIATPATAAALLAAPGSDHEGHSIRSFGCGGSTVPVELLRSFHKRFGLYLRELWGMTEFHGVTTGHPDHGGEPAIGSVGKPFAFHEVKAINIEDGEFAGEVPNGSEGIIVVKGACVGVGYVDPRANEEFFVKGMPDGDVWANTGDLGSMDEEGHVWIHGRAKDLIVRGGHKIDPKVIEEALQHHPAVQVSAAIGRPDARRGEMPIAYVQLKAGSDVSADELIALCQEQISERAAVPIEIITLPAMPMTAVGKIAKPQLRVDATTRVVREVVSQMAPSAEIRDVTVDQTGKRPVARIALTVPESEKASVTQKLEEAFTSFEFSTELSFQAA